MSKYKDQEKIEKYGTPLDNRKMYGKSDWLMWVARLTDDIDERKTFIAMLDEFLKLRPTECLLAIGMTCKTANTTVLKRVPRRADALYY